MYELQFGNEITKERFTADRKIIKNKSINEGNKIIKMEEKYA